jgi:hypothetical protein
VNDKFVELDDKFQHKRRKPDYQAQQKRRYQPSAVEDDRFDKMTHASHLSPPSYGADEIIIGLNRPACRQNYPEKPPGIAGCAFMKAVFAMAVLCAGLATAMAADGIQPGLWKITTAVLNNGMQMPPQTSSRCLTAEQAGDLADTFSPRFGGMNTTCQRTQYEKSEQKLTWRLECRGRSTWIPPPSSISSAQSAIRL